MKKNEERNKIEVGPPESKLKNLSKGYITFPIDENYFKNFVVGLLGKPQTNSKTIKGNFEIHLKDLQNFHDLISQRIEQQNEGKLIQFRTKIFYSDNSSVELGSYDELITYNQVKPVISLAVTLYWSYLIQFSDKNVPEKQEIIIKIKSTSEDRTFIGFQDFIYLTDAGTFDITIHHTARSWGDDIESLLTNQINSIIIKENKVKTFVRTKSQIIGFAVGCILFIGSLYSVLLFQEKFYQSEILRVSQFNSKNPDLDKRINFLTEYLVGGAKHNQNIQVITFILFSISFSAALGIWVMNLADSKTPSFIILTREALKNANKIKEKLKRKWRWFFISLFLSILTGVVANYLFKILIS